MVASLLLHDKVIPKPWRKWKEEGPKYKHFGLKRRKCRSRNLIHAVVSIPLSLLCWLYFRVFVRISDFRNSHFDFRISISNFHCESNFCFIVFLWPMTNKEDVLFNEFFSKNMGNRSISDNLGKWESKRKRARCCASCTYKCCIVHTKIIDLSTCKYSLKH